MSKRRLVKKMNGLILLTDENLEKLRKVVNKTNKKSDLIKIEKFIDQEAVLLDEVFKKAFKNAEKTNNLEFLRDFKEILKNAKTNLSQVSKLEEHSEKKNESEDAEALLKNF